MPWLRGTCDVGVCSRSDGTDRSKKKEKKLRSSTSSTGSAGTGSSGGTLVAAGEMYQVTTHCNSRKFDMSVTFLLSERSQPNVGLVLKEKCYGKEFCQSVQSVSPSKGAG
eukprot:TRINITY_DN1721_c0_g1_i4.p3 TRINITY_DN1721_c0_g1~~TRINITY_DN1721_c0_g1_i4.p3  ORF type:complete len:110 (-),score=16.94 TRINITY_DN1721_c0_g1_i4:228-557(-)